MCSAVVSPLAAFSHTARSLLFALAEIVDCAFMVCLQAAALRSAFGFGTTLVPVDPLLGAVVPPAGVLAAAVGVLAAPAGAV